jgi:hypothetical protein
MHRDSEKRGRRKTSRADGGFVQQSMISLSELVDNKLSEGE